MPHIIYRYKNREIRQRDANKLMDKGYNFDVVIRNCDAETLLDIEWIVFNISRQKNALKLD